MSICIKNEATIDQLRAVELPEETESYTPVSHDWVVEYIEENLEGYKSENTFKRLN